MISGAIGERNNRVKRASPLTAPDNHRRSGPHRALRKAASWRPRLGQRLPTILHRIVTSPIPQWHRRIAGAHCPAPNQHGLPSPHCTMPPAWSWGCSAGQGRPTIAAWLIAPAASNTHPSSSDPTPDDHLTASPHHRLCSGWWWGILPANRRPGIGIGVVTCAIGQRRGLAALTKAAPDHHFGASPDRAMLIARGRFCPQPKRNPGIAGGIVTGAAVQDIGAIEAAPDQHLLTGPYCS